MSYAPPNPYGTQQPFVQGQNPQQPNPQFVQQGTQPTQYGQQYSQQPTQYGQPTATYGQPQLVSSSPYGTNPQLKQTQFVQQPTQFGQPAQQYVQQPNQFGQQPSQYSQTSQFPQQPNQLKQTQFVQQPTQFGQPSQYQQPFVQTNQYGQPSQYPQQPTQIGQVPNYQPQQLKPHQETSWGAQYYNSADQNVLNQLQQVFFQLDVNRSNTLTVNELANLNFVGKPIGLETAKKMVKVFDKDYSGSIEFFEFVAVYQFMVKMQTAFFNADADRSGFLDTNEIHKALDGAGFSFSLATVQAICSKYNTPKGITFDHFLQICGYLASLKSIFEWNDQQKSGKVTFSFDQLAHVCVHLLDPPNDLLQVKYA